jgi:hypothetical protein
MSYRDINNETDRDPEIEPQDRLKLYEMSLSVKIVAETEAEARKKLEAMTEMVWKSAMGGEILFELWPEMTTVESRF